MEIHVHTDPAFEPLIELWTTVFGEPREVFEGVWRGVSPESRIAVSATDVGVLIGSVMIYVLPIMGEDFHPLRLGGIANVSTLKSHQGQGVSSALLAKANDAMMQADCDLSTLYTGIPAHYAKHGYQSFSKPEWEISGEIIPKPAALSAAQLFETQHVSPFQLIRSKGWLEQVSEQRFKRHQIRADQRGYIVYNQDEGKTTILDFGGDISGLITQSGSTMSYIPIPGFTQEPARHTPDGMVLGLKMPQPEAHQFVSCNAFRPLDHF